MADFYINLNSKTDPDLYWLYTQMGSKTFVRAIKECMTATFRGQVGRMIIPSAPTGEVVQGGSVCLHFRWRNCDPDLLEKLNTMPNKARITFFKTVLRINMHSSVIASAFCGMADI